jgi:hypothetical protein
VAPRISWAARTANFAAAKPEAHDIEAIVAKVQLNDVITPGLSAGIDEWRRILDAHLKAMENPELSEEQHEGLHDALLAATRVPADPVMG